MNLLELLKRQCGVIPWATGRGPWYRICTEEGTVCYYRAGRWIKLAEVTNDRDKTTRKVRMTLAGKRYNIPIARIIWTWHNQTDIPEGFEVHHLDTNSTNHHWRNLVCIFHLDHKRVHDILQGKVIRGRAVQSTFLDAMD